MSLRLAALIAAATALMALDADARPWRYRRGPRDWRITVGVLAVVGVITLVQRFRGGGGPTGGWRGRTGTWCLALALAGGATASAQQYPAAPPDGYHVADHANLIADADEAAMESSCARLYREQSVPLVVVTIESMNAHGFGRLNIEQFSAGLYEYLGATRTRWTNGLLLVVSRDDRKARIEPGRDWKGKFDAAASRVMSGTIVPRFRSGDYSGGCRGAVEAIAAAVPSAKSGWGTWTRTSPGGGGSLPGCGLSFGCIAAVVAVIVVIALIKGVTRAISPWSGYGWMGGYGHQPSGCGRSRGYGRSSWGSFGAGALMGGLLGSALRGRSSGGGSWGSRGGFGGGGRGATGSW